MGDDVHKQIVDVWQEEQPITFWVDGKGWVLVDEAPRELLIEAVKLMLREKRAGYKIAEEYRQQLDDIREIICPE
jgi:hypothetical protein